jgi:putative membrane protein
MKISYINRAVLLAGIATLSFAFSPVLRAQMSPTDQTQNSKAVDSTAAEQSTTTGNPQDQTGTLDKTSSRNTTNTLDMNPSLAPTDSANKSATKEPNDTPNSEATQQRSEASSNKDTSSEAASNKVVSDKDFILNAAQGGMTEVELGKVAQEKAASPDVKQFGSRMVTDHSKANDELKTVAQKEGVPIPQNLDAKHQAMVSRLSRLSGPAFDKAYVHAMVRDHEKDAAEFRQASTSAQDPDVKTYAGNTLKVIESHLSDIKSIQSKMQQ